MRSTRRRDSEENHSAESAGNAIIGTGPVLQWVDEVEHKFRFRYQSELTKGSHGSLRSSSSKGNKKLCPKIQLLNYTGEAYVWVKLVTHDHEDHVHKLVLYTKEKIDTPEILHIQMSNTNPRTVELQNVGIKFVGKSNLDQFSHEVVTERSTLKGVVLNEEIKKYRKEVENVVVLCIEAVDANCKRICEPLYSRPIQHYKSRASLDLNIEYVSRVSGHSKGGDDVFIFCTQMHKDNIAVRFFERDSDTDNEVWKDYANIVHVHHQVAIYFKTPSYRHTNLKEKVDVQFELYRESDGQTSEARDFTYIPDDSVELERKKRKTAASFNPQCCNQFVGTEQRNNSNTPVTSATYATNLTSVPSGTTPMENPGCLLEDNITTGLRTESSDPCLAELALVEAEDIEYLLQQPDAVFELQHDPSILDNLMVDSVPQIRPTEIQTHAERVRYATANNDGRIPKRIESVDDIQQERATAALPEVGTGLAYRLALSTARALHEFSRTGDVRFLLASMRHLIAVQDEHGDNAIHSSVIHTQEEALRNLVEVARTVADYDILNMYNEIKQTPLHIAVYTQQTKVIEVLLYHGGNPNLADGGGNTPVHMAAQQCNPTNLGCLEELLNTSNYAAKYESHVPDLNAYNFAGFTALHLAVMAGSELAVRRLCANGCDVDRLDRTTGRSALHLAVEENHLPIIRLLLEEAGADADVHMFNGNTPLHLACSQDQVECISLLMQAQADPYLENLEIAEVGVSDCESSSADQEEMEFRGLTSLDLARSEQVRRLLRGELDPASVKTEVLAAQEIAAPVTAVQQAEKAEKKPSAFDSGIGLSGTNLSMPGDAEDEDASNLHVTDILDELTLRRLSEWLDRDDKWKHVASVVQMKYLISTLEAVPTSPSLAIMSYTKPDKFQEALEKLRFYDELEVFKRARGVVPVDQLEKQVQQLNL